MDRIPIRVSACSIDNCIYGWSAEVRAFVASTQSRGFFCPGRTVARDSFSTPVASGCREMARLVQPCPTSLFSVSTTLARLVFWRKSTNQLVWRTWRQHHCFGSFPADAPVIKSTYGLFKEEIIDHFITLSHLNFPIHFEVLLYNKRLYDSANRFNSFNHYEVPTFNVD